MNEPEERQHVANASKQPSLYMLVSHAESCSCLAAGDPNLWVQRSHPPRWTQRLFSTDLTLPIATPVASCSTRDHDPRYDGNTASLRERHAEHATVARTTAMSVPRPSTATLASL